MRLYHPDLEPPNNEMEVADTGAGQLEAEIWLKGGWKVAPDPPEPQPGLAAEPVRYGPITTAKQPEDMTVEELRAELEHRGLPKSGTKDELLARLTGDDTSTDED